MLSKNSVGLLVAAVVACGGTPHPVQSPEPSPPTERQSEAAESEAQSAPIFQGVPSECAQPEKECFPQTSWVNSLCEEVYAEVALVMFRGGSPWQRRYLRRRTDAVNASGGASISGQMPAGEEVLILRSRGGGANDIQVGSGGGQFDALRWNGSCVSLEGNELTSRVPSRVKHARVEWKWLGDNMRSALRESDVLTGAYRARRKECRGARSGSVSKKCQRLDDTFVATIVKEVRAGLTLSEPETMPN